MTNAPETRKTHVIRILGTNRNGDVLSDIWADVERIDVAKSASQDSQGFWQGVQRKLDWQDDPTRDDYSPDGNPARELEIVKVCDPQTTADVNDPDEWIPVPIIRSMKSRRSDAGTQDRHRNNGPDDGIDRLNEARVVEARRIYHYDTSIDAVASAAFGADPTLKAYVVPGADYIRDETSKDDGQYVEHEIITFLKDSGNDELVSRQGQVKLLNEYLIDESDPAKLDVTGNGGINPPYRLDPYQNIINVQFGADVIVVFVNAWGDPSNPSAFMTFGPSSKAKFLGKFMVPTTVPGAPDAACSAWRVNSNAGDFITATSPAEGDGSAEVTIPLYVHVFAVTSDPDASYQNAKTGTAQVMALLSLPDAPMAPFKGLLWSISMWSMPAKLALRWKMVRHNHRSDKGPLNKIVECYPFPCDYAASGDIAYRVTGFRMNLYRIDPAGTGTIYGYNSIDPIWNQPITSLAGEAFGIPVTDPLPLIIKDLT